MFVLEKQDKRLQPLTKYYAKKPTKTKINMVDAHLNKFLCQGPSVDGQKRRGQNCVRKHVHRVSVRRKTGRQCFN